MKTSSRVTIAVLSGALISIGMAAPALAGTHQPTKMKCEEFVALDDLVQPKVVYWAEGFNRKGKPVDAAVDIAETDELIPVLVTECKETPKASFWEKLKKHF